MWYTVKEIYYFCLSPLTAFHYCRFPPNAQDGIRVQIVNRCENEAK